MHVPNRRSASQTFHDMATASCLERQRLTAQCEHSCNVECGRTEGVTGSPYAAVSTWERQHAAATAVKGLTTIGRLHTCVSWYIPLVASLRPSGPQNATLVAPSALARRAQGTGQPQLSILCGTVPCSYATSWGEWGCILCTRELPSFSKPSTNTSKGA